MPKDDRTGCRRQVDYLDAEQRIIPFRRRDFYSFTGTYDFLYAQYIERPADDGTE